MVMLAAILLGSFVFSHWRIGDAPAIIPIVGTLVTCADFLTAYLMFSQYISNRYLPLGILGAAYVSSGILAVAGVALFPGIVAHPMRDEFDLTMWLRVAQAVIFALVTLGYLWAEKRFPARGSEYGERPSYLVPIIVGTALATLVVVAILVLRLESLPRLAFGSFAIAGLRSGVWEPVVALLVVTLGATLIVTRAQSVTQLWLMVALLALCCSAISQLFAHSRVGIVWYVSLADTVVTATAILTTFLGEIHSMYDRLTKMATIDGLTGVGNRRMFEDRMESAYRHAIRHESALAIIMIDVDFFKRYNDCYGHLAGDDCLRSVASAARLSLTRSLDTIVRYGGEEFAIILPETSARGAEVVAERVRHRVAWLELEHRGSPVAPIVTVSVGVTSLEPGAGETTAELIARADAALYRAKADGRNRVVVVERPGIPQVVALA